MRLRALLHYSNTSTKIIAYLTLSGGLCALRPERHALCALLALGLAAER